MRRAFLPMVFVLAAFAVPACSSGDDENGETDADDATEETFELGSPAFDEGEPIPDEYSFVGGNETPPLEWQGVPAGTEELAITVVDPDASNFVHWVVVGIDPSGPQMPDGQLPPGAVQAQNQFGEPEWGGPAPPAGEPHTYVFTLHALSEPSGITAETTSEDAVVAIDAITADRAELRGLYETP